MSSHHIRDYTSQDTSKEYPIREVCPETKYSQMTATQTLLGLSGQSFYRLDPRLPGKKQVESRRCESNPI